MTLREKQSEFWRKIAMVILWASTKGKPIVILDWMRTKERQEELVKRGRSKTLNSKHLAGLAIDFCFLDDLLDDKMLNYAAKEYQAIILYAESIGLRSGARFGDNPDTELIDGWDLGHLEMGVY